MTAIFIGYIACGVLAYGITFAYFQREFSLVAEMTRDSDRNLAIFVAATGPIGLLASFFLSGFVKHGIKFG